MMKITTSPTTTIECEGFRVLNPGTINCRFHLHDDDIRRGLADEDVLNWDFCYGTHHHTTEQKQRLDQRCIFTLDFLLRSSNVTVIKKQAELSGNIQLNKFYEVFLEQLDIVASIARAEFIATSKLPFAMFSIVLPEMFIGVNTGDTSHAMKVHSVAYHDHMIAGQYIDVSGYIVENKNNLMVYSTVELRVFRYIGDSNIEDLGMFILTETDKQNLMERGKKYIRLTTTPIQQQYVGSISRKSPMITQSYKASGRIMVDRNSMKMMDPSYNYYYGASRNERYGHDDSTTGMQVDMSDPNNLLIISPYVYGFSFAATKWGELLVDNMSDVVYREDAFDKLVLDDKLKQLMLRLVTHSASTLTNNDIIDNKGGGCSFLLDGEPGIGKTLTAESIAEKLKRPLYVVSSGELGITPDELSKRLKNTLDMASTWNAILLIDEADIFLEQRDSNNILRNALVGLFLQLIEYYQGVLFMTTNRVEQIDSAFPSRISLNLHYSELDEAGRKQVWTNLLELLQTADDIDYDKLATAPLNGRNIKQMVRMASITATSESRSIEMSDFDELFGITKQFSLPISKSKSKDKTQNLME